VILVDATPLQSDHRDRGIGTYVSNLSAGLARAAPDRVRFLLSRGGRRHVPAPVAGLGESYRRGHRPAQCYWVYNEWVLRRATRQLRPELFHATDFNGLVNTRTGRTVATLYDLTPLKSARPPWTLSSSAALLRSEVYYRHKLPRAHHIIAISEAVRLDAIRLLDIQPDRVTTVPLGVEHARFFPASKEGAFAGRPPYLLFLGNEAPHKNLERVMQAFASVPPASGRSMCLYIAGPWKQVNLECLRSRATALGICRRVECLGHVPPADLPSLYRNAIAVVCPSLHEGFGLPVLEAMACGTPVLTSDVGAQAQTAGRAAVLADPLDLEALTSALRSIVESPDLRDRLRALGLARASAFSWDETVRRTLTVYDRALAPNPPFVSTPEPS
jgi:glycosyltransferase involved in cell wall biosynthesis